MQLKLADYCLTNTTRSANATVKRMIVETDGPWGLLQKVSTLISFMWQWIKLTNVIVQYIMLEIGGLRPA